MIIFNEEEYANSLLQHGFKRFMSLRDLTILGKFFRYKGMKTAQVRKNLIEFCMKYNPSYNDVVFGWKVDKAVLNSKKSVLRIGNPIEIDKVEVEKIFEIEDYQYRKILFTMLAIARFFKESKGSRIKPNTPYYTNCRFTDILSEAKVSANRQQRMRIMKELTDTGMIEPTLVGGFKIEYAVEKVQDCIIKIEDIENIIGYFPYFCSECGKQLERKPKRRNICDVCYAEKRKESVRENVQKHRGNLPQNRAM